MKPSTRNTLKGAGRELKGKAKVAAGSVTGNRTLKAKGKMQAAAGRVQRKLGKAERQTDRDMRRA